MAQASKANSGGDTASSGKHTAGKGTHGEGFFGDAMWENYAKNFQKMPGGIDFDMLMESHRKNMETIRQAQQTASELLQGLVNLNNHYMRSSFDDLGSQVRTFSGAGTKDMDAKTAASTAAIKAAFDRSISHYKQVTDLFAQSTSKVFDSYRKRFDEGLVEAKTFFKKAST